LDFDNYFYYLTISRSLFSSTFASLCSSPFLWASYSAVSSLKFFTFFSYSPFPSSHLHRHSSSPQLVRFTQNLPLTVLLKLSCHSHVQRAFIACICCVFKVISLVGSNQRDYFENDCRNSAWRAFHSFGQTKFVNGGSNLGSSQFTLLS